MMQSRSRESGGYSVESWKDLSNGSLLAAEALLREGYHRSSVSRAYYAAYYAATHEIVQKLTTFSYGRKNPTHEKVPTYIQSNLTLSQPKKDALTRLINTLRLFREDADYRPHMSIDDQTARDCIRDAAAFQQELWGR
jgi:uncharacterized protein (UPF0332 family)